MSGTAIIYNPHAGAGKKDASNVLKNIKWPVFELKEGDRAQDIVARLLRDRWFTRFIAAGGDGTVHDVVSGIGAFAEGSSVRQVSFGILPLGTANDLARSLGMSEDIWEAATQLQIGKTRDFYIGKAVCGDTAEVRYFANAACGGFVPRLGETIDSELKEFWGRFAYIRGGLEALPDSEPCRLTISYAEERLSLPVWNLIIAIGSSAGGGIKVASEQSKDPRKFQVVVFHGSEFTDFLKAGASFFLNGESSGTNLRRFLTNEITVSGADFPWSADGEKMGSGSYEFSFLPEPVQIIVG